MTKIKKFIYFFLIFFLIFTFYYNRSVIFSTTKQILPSNIKSVIKVIKSNELSTKQLNNDYNTKFLPETQFVNLSFKKIKTNIQNSNISGYANFLKTKTSTFYIDTYKDNLFLFYKNGESYFSNIDGINESGLNLNKIKNDLKNISISDILINNSKIYVTGSLKIDENCNKFTVYESNIDIKIFEFTEIFQDPNCYGFIQGGRVQYYPKDNSILVGTAADILKNQIDQKPQDVNSLMGKIIKINLDNVRDYEIYSSGHRNIIGMYANEDVILATENGPRGGDEINLIKKGKNYGWPISSYGEKYKDSNQEEPFYKKNHSDFGYKEPIYSFVPSIGISEIIKIENNFTKQWTNNFLIASLFSRHIYRVSFDKKYLKVKYIEKIYIGERIRDMKYYDNLIFLALEETNSVGILKLKTSNR
tara:strand:+ start:409 stop:1662 length:1254 start_codon:yes stop_codon:yes gene_type:complete